MEEKEDYEQRGDLYKVNEIQNEIDEIVKHYNRAIGLGGNSRKFNRDNEKARISVTKAIDRACEKIKKKCPSLAQHFQTCIETGYSCSYKPNSEIVWDY
jgi:hypothetical protein